MMAVKNGEITPDLIEWLVADPEVGQKEVDNSFLIREVCKKSKWKFKMAFAMKGGGSRGGLVCH